MMDGNRGRHLWITPSVVTVVADSLRSRGYEQFARCDNDDAETLGCAQVIVTAGDDLRAGAAREGDEVVVLRARVTAGGAAMSACHSPRRRI